MDINCRISDFCESKNILQTHLVVKGYGSKQTISFIFNGKQFPNYKFLHLLISDNLDLNANWLFTGNGEMLLSRISYPLSKSLKENSQESMVTTYSCSDCIEKQKEIDILNTELKDITRKYILTLEELQDKRGCG